jgi:hypothetical protein
MAYLLNPFLMREGVVPDQFDVGVPNGTIVASVGVAEGIYLGYKECVVGFYDFAQREVTEIRGEYLTRRTDEVSLADIAIDKNGNKLACILCKKNTDGTYQCLVRLYNLDSYFGGAAFLAEFYYTRSSQAPAKRDIYNLAGGCVSVLVPNEIVDIRLSEDSNSVAETARRPRRRRVLRVITGLGTEVTLVNKNNGNQHRLFRIGDAMSTSTICGQVKHAVLVKDTTIAAIMRRNYEYRVLVYNFARQKIITAPEIRGGDEEMTGYCGLCVAPGPQLWAVGSRGFVVVDLEHVDLTESD